MRLHSCRRGWAAGWNFFAIEARVLQLYLLDIYAETMGIKIAAKAGRQLFAARRAGQPAAAIIV